MEKVLDDDIKAMDELINQMEKRLRRKGNVILIIGIILVLISPIILTRDFGLFNFNNTGAIGDTIGGLTSP